MSSATPLIIPTLAQEGIIQLHRQCYSMLNQQWNLREQMRQMDLAYIRETDFTKQHKNAQLSNRYGDSTKFQNVTVPVVMPQVEAAVTYQASVFLTGVPIFGWVAAPNQEDAALQYQAIVEENSIRGAWIQQFLIFFRDCFKYNLGIVETIWDRQVTAAIETDTSFTGGREGKPKEVIWQGNCVNRWDPYNSFWDSRYHPTSVYKDGEFAGNTRLMSRVHLKKFINELPDKMVANIKEAFESGMGSIGGGSASNGIESYYLPQINPDALILNNSKNSTDWFAWASIMERPAGEINYKNIYEVTQKERFERDFGLASQIQRASVSIMANIAEGFARKNPNEFYHFTSIAKSSASEVRSHLYVGLDIQYITEAEFQQLIEQTKEVERLVGGLLASGIPKG